MVWRLLWKHQPFSMSTFYIWDWLGHIYLGVEKKKPGLAGSIPDLDQSTAHLYGCSFRSITYTTSTLTETQMTRSHATDQLVISSIVIWIAIAIASPLSRVPTRCTSYVRYRAFFIMTCGDVFIIATYAVASAPVYHLPQKRAKVKWSSQLFHAA